MLRIRLFLFSSVLFPLRERETCVTAFHFASGEKFCSGVAQVQVTCHVLAQVPPIKLASTALTIFPNRNLGHCQRRQLTRQRLRCGTLSNQPLPLKCLFYTLRFARCCRLADLFEAPTDVIPAGPIVEAASHRPSSTEQQSQRSGGHLVKCWQRRLCTHCNAWNVSETSG